MTGNEFLKAGNYIKILILLLLIFFLPTELIAIKEPVSSPDFKLQDTRQDIITLSSYKDEQPVVLFFWATWCPFCQKELSVLNNMYAGLVEEGIEVLAINVGELSDEVSNFIKSYNLAYRVLLDKDTTVARTFQAEVPTYILIDKKGQVVFRDDYFPYEKYKELILEGK